MIILGNNKIDIFCIGTPRVVGDAIGPLVGSMLNQQVLKGDIRIIGTLDDPVMSNNYDEKYNLIRPGATIIAVDAVTTLLNNKLGTFGIDYGSLSPGSSLDKGLQPVGDIAVKCYTAPTVEDMFTTDPWFITMMAYSVVHELVDLLNTTKIKEYISI